MVIPIEIVGEKPVGHHAMIEEGSNQLSKRGIMVGKSLFNQLSDVVPVRVVNVSNQPLRIYKQSVPWSGHVM